MPPVPRTDPDGTPVALLAACDRLPSLTLLLFAAFVALVARARQSPTKSRRRLQRSWLARRFPMLSRPIWTDVRAFYTQREHAPAWVDHRRPTDTAAKSSRSSTPRASMASIQPITPRLNCSR